MVVGWEIVQELTSLAKATSKSGGEQHGGVRPETVSVPTLGSHGAFLERWVIAEGQTADGEWI